VSCDYSSTESLLDLDAQGSFQVSLPSIIGTDSMGLDVVDVEECAPNQENAISAWIPPLDSIHINRSLTTIVDDSLRFSTTDTSWIHQCWHFSDDQLGILLRFRERTSTTIGNPQMAPIYQDPICRLACKVR
jgi:hypothetical protein